ncbi:MAG: hypothetical protein ACKOED_14945 [Aestuariivirga sp.]|uniref:hypothetical protein n=1 Tax=Aestuariivirga sp. TaxID=2650926 RepID=UPI0038D1B55F
MPVSGTIYLYRSAKIDGLFCFSNDPDPEKLPASLSPWRRFGVVKPGENLPHGLDPAAITAGMREHGYQLYRRKPPGRKRS